MKQAHKGQGDNVGRDKIVKVFLSKKVIISLVVILAVSGLLYVWFGDYLQREYFIEGVVVNHSGYPAKESVVELTIDGKGDGNMVTTDINGNFILQVPKIPSSLEVKVFQKNKLSFKKSYERNSFANLPLSIKLPMGDPPFRVTYWILDEFTFSAFVSDKIHNLGPIFENSMLLKNDILDEVENYYTEYADDVRVQQRSNLLSLEDSKNTKKWHDGFDFNEANNDIRLLPNQLQLPSLYLSEGNLLEGPELAPNYKYNKWGVFRFSKSELIQGYNVELGEYKSEEDFEIGYDEISLSYGKELPGNKYNTEIFWNNADLSDFYANVPDSLYIGVGNVGLKELSKKTKLFFQYFAKNDPPKYFGIKILRNCVFGHCYGIDLVEDGVLIIPDVSIVIVQIENINDEPLSLDKFFTKKNDKRGPRYFFQDTIEFNRLSSSNENLLSRPMLKGDKVILPLYFYLSHASLFGISTELDSGQLPIENPYLQDDFPYGGKYNYNQSVKTEIMALRSQGVDMPFNSRFFNNHQGLVDLNIDRPSIDSLRFVVGPSITLDSLQANNAIYPVRKFNPNILFVEGGHAGGASCPFVYTFNNNLNQWINEGVILNGYDSKLKEKFSEKNLRHFNEKILIKEKDSETSYLNSFQIKLIGKDGIVEILIPLNKSLQYDDAQYIILEKGEELVVRFKERKKRFEVINVVLISKGYYVPYIEIDKPLRVN